MPFITGAEISLGTKIKEGAIPKVVVENPVNIVVEAIQKGTVLHMERSA